MLVGGSNHLEKYECQWEGLSHILWKRTHVPNHQPAWWFDVILPTKMRIVLINNVFNKQRDFGCKQHT